MNVAYLINDYPRVSHSFIRREMLALERRGVEITRIALRGWDGDLPDEADRAERLKTHYLLQRGIFPLLLSAFTVFLAHPVRFARAALLAARLSRSSDRGLLYHCIYLCESCALVRFLRPLEIERLHAHFGTNSTTVAMLARALGGPPFSFTAHGPEEFQRPMGLPEKIAQSAAVVAISSYGRSQLFLHAALSEWGKIHVVHCGLEASFFDRVRRAGTVSRRLVCVGRLCEAKGQLLLLEAASRLVELGIQFELALAGDGPLRPVLERRIAELRLEAYVQITGWISSGEVKKQLLGARAMVLPSFAEGLPVVIMEAMALRRPVISTYVAGIPELVIAPECGWLVPPGSVEELTGALAECLSASDERLEAMGELAFQRVTTRHSIDNEAAKLLHILQH